MGALDVESVVPGAEALALESPSGGENGRKAVGPERRPPLGASVQFVLPVVPLVVKPAPLREADVWAHDQARGFTAWDGHTGSTDGVMCENGRTTK